MAARRMIHPGQWLGVVGLCFLVLGPALHAEDSRRSEDPRRGESKLPAVFDKDVPESINDLQEIQKHVKTLLEKTMPCTVGIRIGPSQGSGVIVTGDGYVLTAGHVSGTPDRDCQIILPDGRKLKGKTLGANRGIDSGLIKILDSGDYPFCAMAKSADLKKGQWCLAIGHPGGWQPGRSPVVRLGRVQETSKSFLRTDCTLVGGDSGGPLFDMDGQVIGIHSRIGNLITANIHVPVDTYRDTWDRLAKGEEWGGSLFGGGGKASDAYLGLRIDPDGKGCRIINVNPDSPAEKAGLKVEDMITKFDGKNVASLDELANFLQKRQPGTAVALEIQRGGETLTLRVTLGKRPS